MKRPTPPLGDWHGPASRRPDGPDPEHQHRGGFHLPHHGGGAGAGPPALLLHPRPAVARRGAGDRAGLAGRGAPGQGRPLHARAGDGRRPGRDGRGLAAPGSALRHGLHHHDACARQARARDAGGQRSLLGAELSREAPGAAIPRTDAADHGGARPRDLARRGMATSSSSRSTATAVPGSSGSTPTTATSPRSGRSSPASTASR